MHLDISHIGQISLAVRDLGRAERFYATTLGLRNLFRVGDVSVFDCGEVQLMLEMAHDPGPVGERSVIYLRCADIVLAVRELEERGVVFTEMPFLVARMDDHDLWRAYFKDPDGHRLGLFQEAPKGFVPAALV